MAKILIVEDHPIFRRGVRDILTANPQFSVVEEAEDAESAGRLLREEHWDALILDISLPGKSGLEFMKELKAQHPKLPVLVLSVESEEQYAIRMLRAGASGYLTKDRTPEEVVQALSRLLDGRKYVSETLAERVVTELRPEHEQPAYQRLSDREFEILKLIAEGFRPREISRRLHLSPHTISTYRARLLDKLNAKSNARLVQYAVENKLLGARPPLEAKQSSAGGRSVHSPPPSRGRPRRSRARGRRSD